MQTDIAQLTNYWEMNASSKPAYSATRCTSNTCPISATLRCIAQLFTSLLRVVPGCAIAQAVSRRFPAAVDRLRSWAKSCGICGEQSRTGRCILRVLRFPLPILIPPSSPYSSIIRGWYNGPAYQVDSVSPYPKKIKKTTSSFALSSSFSPHHQQWRTYVAEVVYNSKKAIHSIINPVEGKNGNVLTDLDINLSRWEINFPLIHVMKFRRYSQMPYLIGLNQYLITMMMLNCWEKIKES
jgi:hypothetical protein